MPNEMNQNDARSLWQSQEAQITITLEEIRRRAARFERRVWWRNMREYAAGGVVIAFFTAQLWFVHGWGFAPPLLLIAGAIYVMTELHRRGAARPLPAEADTRTSLAFYRLELERQRDALESVWRWYLLPIVPGLAADVVVSALGRGIHAGTVALAVFLAFLLVSTWALNQRAARRLDGKIRELKAMENGDE